jgi:hypothetical protein
VTAATRQEEDSMSRSWRRHWLTVVLAAVPRAVTAQDTDAAAWDSVARILQTPTTVTGEYHRYNLPRHDLTLRVGDVVVSPALALGAWAGFGGPPGDAALMGDLVVTAAELRSVLAELAKQGIAVTAIHNHLVGETPQITYVHFHAQGNAVSLAARLDRGLAGTATPRPVAPTAHQPLSIDTALVFGTLGRPGRAQGNVAQVSFVLVPGPVTMHGREVLPALGYGTPINVQMVDASRAVATGDFAVLGASLDPVMDALAAHGILATAVHNHLVDEHPTVYYVHFWGDGRLDAVLAGLRAALDAAR